MYSAVVRALAKQDRRRYTQKYGGDELSLDEGALLGSLGSAHRYTVRIQSRKEEEKEIEFPKVVSRNCRKENWRDSRKRVKPKVDHRWERGERREKREERKKEKTNGVRSNEEYIVVLS